MEWIGRRSRRARARWERVRVLVGALLSVVLVLVAVRALSGEPDPDAVAAAAKGLPPPPKERVRVEVLNASRIARQAWSATRRLREAGFDVVYFGNAGQSAQPDTTLVIDRVGRPELAEHVVEVLGVGKVVTLKDPDLLLEVTVQLGKDWVPPPDPWRAQAQ